jgi:type IV pilus assembly protein PilA
MRSVHHPRPAARRGYTLVEVLVVVAMIGVLATLAVASYMRWLRWANIAETKQILGAIATGQQRYYAQTQGYLSCSSSMTDYYPMAPNGGKHLFHDSSLAQSVCWKVLAAEVTDPTYMGFVTMAGDPGTAWPQLPTDMQITVPAPTDRPWFVALAAGDQDEDGVMSYFVTSSAQPSDVHVENEDE